jgi:hypothetical protein
MEGKSQYGSCGGVEIILRREDLKKMRKNYSQFNAILVSIYWFASWPAGLF